MKKTSTQNKPVSKKAETQLEQRLNEVIENNKQQLQNILQHAPAAIAVLDGPEHKYILVNIAYQKLFNRQAKDFFGKSMHEVFPELKNSGAFELVDRVFETGESFTAPEYGLLVNANNDGVLRQNYYHFSIEPLKNDSGEIYAVTAIVYDITEQVESRKKIEESEKQHAFLLKLSDALRPLSNPVAIEETATKIALDFMDADRCYYNTIEEGNAIVLRDAFHISLTSLAGIYPISKFPLFKAVVDAGRPFIVDDVYTSDIIEEGLRQICAQVQVISMINVPVIKNSKTVGVLSLVQSKPRKWTETEVQLTKETAERTWAAIEKAKVEEALNTSEEKYRTLLTSIDQGFILCELIRNKEGKGIDLTIMEVNPTYEQQTGVKREMVIGKPLLQVFPSLNKWIDTYAAVVDNQRTVAFEQYFEYTDRWFAMNAYPVQKERFAVLFSDITDQKQASQYTRSLIEASLDPLVTISADGKITDVNEASIKVTGIEREKLIGTDFSNYFTEPKKAQEGYQQVFEKGFVADYPLTIKHKNGKLTDVLYNASVYKDDKGNVLGVFAAARDVTERKKAEDKIIESEKKTREIKEQLELSIGAGKIGLWFWDKKNDKLTWSNEQKEMYGFSTSEVITSAAQVNDLVIPEDLKRIQVDENDGNKIDHEHNFRIIRKNDGELRWIKSRARNTFDSQGALQSISGVNIDVTEQVLALNKIQESENRFRDMADASPVLIWTLDTNGWSSFYNKTFFDFIGLSKDDDISNWEKIVHPDDFQSTFDTINTAIAKNSSYRLKCRLLRADGQWRWVLCQGNPRMGVNNEFLGFVGSGVDFTEQNETEEELESQKQKLESVTENTDMALFLMDEKQFCIYMNPAAEKMTGFTFKELKGEQLHYHVHHSHPDGSPYPLEECPIDQALPSQNRMKGEDFFVHKDGSFYPVAFTASPITLNGNTIGTVIEAKDTTEEKRKEQQLKESEIRFRIISDASPVHIWTIDAHGLPSYYNKTFLDFIGVPKSEDIADWKKIIHPDDLEEALDTMNTAITGRSNYSLECRMLRADGEWRWMLAHGNPHMNSNDEFLGFVGSSVDITERKQFEYELMKAKTAAENAARSKQQFLSNMSHEIRTPLNSIIGFTNVLLKTELGAEQKEFIQAIKTSGKSLNLLINDILDLAKVDAGKMTFEAKPFEIRKSITSLLHSFEMKIREKNLELVEEYDNKIPSVLVGDSLRLNQIFLNLISNAVKFTHKGKIKLSVELLSETVENAMLKFVVTDSGIGIADDKLISIFNVFEQAEHSTSTSYGGTGLGLAIVKQLVEVQGGNISVKSKLGEGSAFSFILPFGKTNLKLEAEIEILKPDSEIKNLRVLVAEDVSLNQLLIKIILNDFGFEQEIVSNGKLAIEKMQTNTYDIILMDLQMPEMNGFEATEYIRKTLKSQIPIIALTADVTTVDISKCREFGMDDYISKPISENLLYSKMVELVKKKE